MKSTYQSLVDAAFAAQKNAYAPYSNFHIGAALLTRDGHTVIGANIENASYGLTLCGERNAVFSAYAQGYRKEDIVALAIVSDSNPVASPCGACRQVLIELLEENTPVILASSKGGYQETSAKELLPFAFTKEQL
ncbi:MAG: cytidine deaminase [Bacilli bacterium]|jgi:cytidine deaminase